MICQEFLYFSVDLYLKIIYPSISAIENISEEEESYSSKIQTWIGNEAIE